MNNNQENQLSMSKAVQSVLNDNAATVSALVPFQTAKTDLDATINTINAATQLQVQNITGTAQDKEQAAEAAITKALTLIGPAKSYAKAMGNNSLFQALNYSPSSFKKMRDTEIANTLRMISGTLQVNIADLVSYGVTPADVTNLAALIESYSALVSAPRNAISNKSAATMAVAQAFVNLKPILLRLDGFIEGQKNANPDFYNAYKTARVIVDNRGKTKKKAVANTTPQ